MASVELGLIEVPENMTWNDYLDFYEVYLATTNDEISPLDGFFSFPDGVQINNAKLVQGLLRRNSDRDEDIPDDYKYGGTK